MANKNITLEKKSSTSSRKLQLFCFASVYILKLNNMKNIKIITIVGTLLALAPALLVFANEGGYNSLIKASCAVLIFVLCISTVLVIKKIK